MYLPTDYNSGFTTITPNPPPRPVWFSPIEEAKNPIYQKNGFLEKYKEMSEKGQLLRNKNAPIDLAMDLQNELADEAGAFIFVQERSSGDRKVTAMTNNFWLTSMAMSFKERLQITESFDSSHFMFMGNNIKIYNFSGFSIDGASSNEDDPGGLFYQSSLIKMYNEKLRGTMLTKSNEIAVLSVANHVIKGYPTDFAVSYTAEAGNLTQFNFSWIVVDHYMELDGVVNDKRLTALYTPSAVGFTDTELGELAQIDTVLELAINGLNTNDSNYKALFEKAGIKDITKLPTNPLMALETLFKVQKETIYTEVAGNKTIEYLIKEAYRIAQNSVVDLEKRKADYIKNTMSKKKKVLYGATG